jgi:NTP pyrophosphatase (non-canonical NTP hydrolase)
MASVSQMILLRLQMERRSRDERQKLIMNWIRDTFGSLPGLDVESPRERAMRFLEEALELCQAAGLTQGDVYSMARYTYGRPAGVLAQEAGGVAVTLYALCEVFGISAAQAEFDEIGRVMDISPDKFQARHVAKMEKGI